MPPGGLGVGVLVSGVLSVSVLCYFTSGVGRFLPFRGLYWVWPGEHRLGNLVVFVFYFAPRATFAVYGGIGGPFTVAVQCLPPTPYTNYTGTQRSRSEGAPPQLPPRRGCLKLRLFWRHQIPRGFSCYLRWRPHQCGNQLSLRSTPRAPSTRPRGNRPYR